MSEEKTKPRGPYQAIPIQDVEGFNPQWDYTHRDVLNKKITVLAFIEIKTQYGEALLVDCDIEGKKVKVLIGGMVLIDQLLSVQSHLPVEATVIKEDRYYTFQ